MKKITDFLEKYCQWVAIALGAVYMLWMVYRFVLTNGEYTVPVGTEQKLPGNVDETVDNVAQQLRSQLKGPKPKPIRVPSFASAIDTAPEQMPSFALAWANSPTQDVTIANNPSNPQTPQPGPNNPAQPGLAAVVQLPAAPAPTDVFTAVGRSNATIPPPVQVVANGQPNQPQPQNNGQTVATGTDIDWVTVSYKISLNDLAKEFQRTNIPPQNYPTAMLDVQLVRQEQQADGSWGPETVCPKLTTSTQPPFPAADSSKQQRQSYVNWAVGASPEILQPKFYDVVKGDPWTLPKELVGSGAVGDNGAVLILGPNDVRPGFDPTQFATTDPKQLAQQEAAMQPPLTLREKQLISKARTDAQDKAAAEKAKSRGSTPSGPTGGARPPSGGYGGPGGAGGGAGGRGGGRGGYAADDGNRPPQQFPPYRGPGADANLGGPPMPMGGPGMPYGGQQNSQASNFSGMFPLPITGAFDPRTIIATPPSGNGNAAVPAGTIVGWAHDWKPEPGKTYRYMVRYKIQSPVWSTINVTKPAALADQFAISSANSAWTDPITVPSVVTFFFASSGLGNASTAVEVFRWADGVLHEEHFRVSPGDAIGMDKGGIDFGTGFTLVDLRPDFRNEKTTAWLLTAEGAMIKRDVNADMSSPQKQQMESQVAAATAAANAANGTGTPTAIGGAPPAYNPTR